MMRDLIISKLSEIEKEHQIKILYACESGSRAWGFPSPNSDYDVRFIYVHELDWYLSLHDQKDTIDLPINDDLDIGGWEIKKALKLLGKSNAPLLEWIQSPIVYQVDPQFIQKVQSAGIDCFSSIAVMHHYLSMSKKYTDDCVNSDQVKLKKYFYAFRATIAGQWVREKKTTPPIVIQDMFKILDDKVRDRIEEMIDIKAIQNEDYLHPSDTLINDFLIKTIEENEKVANDLPTARGNVEYLDDLLKTIVKGAQ